jgi:hypothetical protein
MTVSSILVLHRVATPRTRNLRVVYYVEFMFASRYIEKLAHRLHSGEGDLQVEYTLKYINVHKHAIFGSDCEFFTFYG